ncbi:tetratricopeptide repeat protein [Oryzicola mucosus]|uniref:Tetratricopeptide repeat protein n=1 Tax=Oryzicola mucosus TaxID=2767425 RepID=A0A8J6PGC5_9HYPH|nr:hypothetical protein [Oryzicola mucosus]MBD0413463.1 hypothetical protein [Oryzicola mucosus]
MIAFSQGLGRVLETANPALASILDPFNGDARLRLLLGRASGPLSATEFEVVQGEIGDALAFSPIESRLFSLRGEIERQNGRTDAALRSFQTAQALSKTDLLAAQGLAALFLSRGQAAASVKSLDLILRRSPDRIAELAPVIAEISADHKAYRAVVERLEADAPWRTSLISFLASGVDSLDIAERLLGDLSVRPPYPAEIAAVISGRLKQHQFERAHSFFLFTLTPSQKAIATYVFNSELSPQRLYRKFDWETPVRPGVELTWSTDGSSSPKGARVRFLGAPVKDVGLNQTLMLPPGEYRLGVSASATGLVAPKGLAWELSCGGDSPMAIAKLALDAGEYSDREFGVNFNVPSSNCPVMQLRLMTDLVAGSWRSLYRGEVIIHSVRIERVEG